MDGYKRALRMVSESHERHDKKPDKKFWTRLTRSQLKRDLRKEVDDEC